MSESFKHAHPFLVVSLPRFYVLIVFHNIERKETQKLKTTQLMTQKIILFLSHTTLPQITFSFPCLPMKVIIMSFAVAFLSSTSRRSATAFVHKSHNNRSSTTQLNVSFLEKAFSSLSTNSNTNNVSNNNKFYTVAITGSTGLLGNALIDELTKKEEGLVNGKPLRIVKLTRSSNINEGEGKGLETRENELITSINWNPNAKKESSLVIDPESLESIDTIVHLAGENVGSGLLPGPLGALGIQAWSKEKKDLIMTSRVESTEALANAIAACKKPTNFIVASGVGIYGNDFIANENDSLSSCPDESFEVSNTSGFLAEVSRKWEAASQPAVQGGLLKKNRLVNLRIAPVMSKLGGALGKLYPIFFLGGGGVVGSGKQYFSYISARDAARAIVHVIETPSISGPINLVAPTPCTNAEFTKAMGKVLFRPTILPLPEFAVKLLFGEMGEDMLLGGVKAAPKKLLDSGFKFQHETIAKAVESAVQETI